MPEPKVFLVTGAGPGSLGEATAAALREHGRVITTRRSGAATADFHPLDLADADSVRAFADWLGDGHRPARRTGQQRRHPPRPAQEVARAAAARRSRDPLAHQLPRHRAPDPAAAARRCCAPLPTSGEARVVNVVSKLHTRGRNEWLDGGVTPYDSWDAYGTSKLALVHEAAEIERRYGDQGLHGYSLHPGAVYTKVADRGLETAPVLGRLRKLPPRSSAAR